MTHQNLMPTDNNAIDNAGNEDFKESQDEIYDAVGDYFENELAKDVKGKKTGGALAAAADLSADLHLQKQARPRVMSTVTNIDASKNSRINFLRPKTNLKSFHALRRNSALDPKHAAVNMELATSIKDQVISEAG